MDIYPDNKLLHYTNKFAKIETRMFAMIPDKKLTYYEPEASNPTDILGISFGISTYIVGFYTMFVSTDILNYQRVGNCFTEIHTYKGFLPHSKKHACSLMNIN